MQLRVFCEIIKFYGAPKLALLQPCRTVLRGGNEIRVEEFDKLLVEKALLGERKERKADEEHNGRNHTRTHTHTASHVGKEEREEGR